VNIDLDKYARLKKRAAEIKSEFDRAEGVLAEQMKKLKADFGVDTLEEADQLLVTMQSEAQAAKVAYDAAMQEHETLLGKL
jgi:hypothetical protein